MSPIQITVQEIKQIIRRRIRLLIAVPVFMTIVAIAAAYLITPKYKSSITILVQKEQTLNPLVLYEMAVNIASEDRLKSFNEIIYSRKTVELLIDSLELAKKVDTNYEKQELIERTKRNINTTFKASDSFDITYYDTDPNRAQRGASILANHFIETRLSLENRRNEQTVEFFEDKIAELEKAVKKRQQNLLDLNKKRIEQSPIDNTALNHKLQDIERQIESNRKSIQDMNRILKLVGNISRDNLKEKDVQELYTLPLEEIPLGGELQKKLQEYDQLSQRYTKSYPAFKTLENQIFDILNRMPSAINTDIEFKQLNIKDLEQQRDQILGSMEENVVANRVDEVEEADYGIYRKLYDEMKVKLEQARTTRDLGKKAVSQFVVIDPPHYPEKPASPNRPLIIAGGLFIGIILSLIATAAAEILDTIIRSEEDMRDFDAPVIAYITDGSKN